MVLAELKRENNTLASQEGGVGGVVKKQPSAKDQAGGAVDQMDVDIDYLMEDIRKEITRIHTVCCEGPGMDGPGLKAKPTIDILQEIEVKLDKHMLYIKYTHDKSFQFSKAVVK